MTEENWPPSHRAKRNRICTPCHSERVRQWEKDNRERHLAAHATRNRKRYKTAEYRRQARDRARERRAAAGCKPYSRETDGYVYFVVNPAWPGYVKLGSAFSLRSRLNQYQTGSPFRDYQIIASARFADCRAAEALLRDQLRGHRVGNHEWLQLHPADARNHLKRLAKQEQE